MKLIISASLLLALTCSSLKALEPISLMIPAAATVAADLLTRGKDNTTRVSAIGGAAILGSWYASKRESDAARERFKNYQQGKFQEAWIRANTDWYYSTLDRRSGLPTAFDGHWAMFVGLPDIEAQVAERRTQLPAQVVPTGREDYIAYLNQTAQNQQAVINQEKAKTLIEVPVVKATMPERTVNGITFRPQQREFPTLP